MRGANSVAKAAGISSEEGGKPAPAERPRCGIVMPISAIDDCPAAHWADVRTIIEQAADTAGFNARLVSSADYAGVILKEIIHNLYHDPIVVCDVSGRNPNVMFELGMRLAFDQPTILIKDDSTNYSFDTSPIEHLEYPRDLRYGTMVDFKERLAEKLQATHQQATKDKNYTTFLAHFGRFKVASVETTEVSGQQYIIEEIKEIKSYLRRLALSHLARDEGSHIVRPQRDIEMTITGSDDQLEEAMRQIRRTNGLYKARIENGVLGCISSMDGGRQIKDIADQLGLKYDARLVRLSSGQS
jgi:hypothetical protein